MGVKHCREKRGEKTMDEETRIETYNAVVSFVKERLQPYNNTFAHVQIGRDDGQGGHPVNSSTFGAGEMSPIIAATLKESACELEVNHEGFLTNDEMETHGEADIAQIIPESVSALLFIRKTAEFLPELERAADAMDFMVCAILLTFDNEPDKCDVELNELKLKNIQNARLSMNDRPNALFKLREAVNALKACGQDEVDKLGMEGVAYYRSAFKAAHKTGRMLVRFRHVFAPDQTVH